MAAAPKKKTAHKTIETEEQPDPQAEKEASQRSVRLALLVLAVIILLFASAVVVPRFLFHNAPTQTFEYNGYTFEKRLVENTKVEAYFTQFYDIQGRLNEVPFHFAPQEVEHLHVDTAIKDALINFDRSGTLYIAVEPDAEDMRYVLAATEIAKITGARMMGIKTSSALTAPIDGRFDVEVVYLPVNGTNETRAYNKTLRTSQTIPVRNCADAGPKTMVVQVKQMDRDYVAMSDNCITISATDSEHALMLTDALLYRLLGIMDNS